MAINVQAVPVTPEQPKLIPQQQLFVWLNKKSIEASVILFGDKITGTAVTAVFPSSGITYTNLHDVYVNISLNENRGRVYSCVLAGIPSEAVWSYVGTFDGVLHSTEHSTAAILNYDIVALTQYTNTKSSGFTTINLTLPDEIWQGFIAEVDVRTHATTACTLSITNNTGYGLQYIVNGITKNTYEPPLNKEIDLLFRFNGFTIVCLVMEIDR